MRTRERSSKRAVRGVAHLLATIIGTAQTGAPVVRLRAAGHLGSRGAQIGKGVGRHRTRHQQDEKADQGARSEPHLLILLSPARRYKHPRRVNVEPPVETGDAVLAEDVPLFGHALALLRRAAAFRIGAA